MCTYITLVPLFSFRIFFSSSGDFDHSLSSFRPLIPEPRCRRKMMDDVVVFVSLRTKNPPPLPAQRRWYTRINTSADDHNSLFDRDDKADEQKTNKNTRPVSADKFYGGGMCTRHELTLYPIAINIALTLTILSFAKESLSDIWIVAKSSLE